MDCAQVPAAARSTLRIIAFAVVLVVIFYTGNVVAADSSATRTIALASAEPAHVARGQTVSLKVIHVDDLPIPPDQTIAVLLEACSPGNGANNSGCAEAYRHQKKRELSRAAGSSLPVQE